MMRQLQLLSKALIILSCVGIFVPAFATEHEEQKARERIAFFGFRLINSTTQKPSDDERKRLQSLEAKILQEFQKNDHLEVVAVSEDIRQAIEGGQFFGQCRCEQDYGRKVGAQLMAWGTVQKVSDLILNINLYVADVESNQYKFVKSVDIRGNTDETWMRGLRWLLRYYFESL